VPCFNFGVVKYGFAPIIADKPGGEECVSELRANVFLTGCTGQGYCVDGAFCVCVDWIRS
jgi:hypothetical protein